MFFSRGFADLQKPFAAASMTRFGYSHQREYKLKAASFALPPPVAVDLHIDELDQNPRGCGLTVAASSSGGAPKGVSRLPSSPRFHRERADGAATYRICAPSARDAKYASAAAIAESPCLPLPSIPARRSAIFATPCSSTNARWSDNTSASLGISIVPSSNAA